MKGQSGEQSWLSRVTGEPGSRPFFVERRPAVGTAEPVYTTFDHSLICQRLYELTGDAGFLRLAVDHLLPAAVATGPWRRWYFSPAVTDIPPDADSTSVALLLIALAARRGVTIPDEFDPAQQVSQFEALLTASGGIRTYFGDRPNNEVDPVVNLALAETLLATSNLQPLYPETRRFINNTVRSGGLAGRLSEYYLGSAFFAERLARIAHVDQDFLSPAAMRALDHYLEETRPNNPLEAAMLGIGCFLRGKYPRGEALTRLLERSVNSSGGWGFAPFYIQRTPRYDYGSAAWTTATVRYAFKLCQRGHARRCWQSWRLQDCDCGLFGFRFCRAFDSARAPQLKETAR
ncbi:MAG: hypothetical protein H7A45_03760 [Verrucomicrobiales bacterium]|nr:hypothetical protein [Verrucomicrobiales bacterium]